MAFALVWNSLKYNANNKCFFCRSLKTDISKVEKVCRDLVGPLEINLRRIRDTFLDAVEVSFAPETRYAGGVPCFNTHISRFPKSLKKGEFLSMHLGSRDLSFMRLTVEEKKQLTPRVTAVTIPVAVKHSSGPALFDFIAENLRDFVWGHSMLRTEHIPLVFSFSFPLEQTSIDRGRIQSWAKGFRCERSIGHDVNKLLRQAANKYELSLDIKAIVNDVCGTFFAGRVASSLCAGGIVLGRGTNASYLELKERVPDYSGDGSSPYVLINTEWGAFGEKGELAHLVTDFDEQLDKNTENPGKHRMEKMVGSLYIGELIRLIIAHLTAEGIMFGGQLPPLLGKPGSFNTGYIPYLLRGEDPIGVLEKEIDTIVMIARAASLRSARLVAGCVAALTQRLALPVAAFAVSGQFFQLNPYSSDIKRFALESAGPGLKKISFLTVPSALTGAAVLSSALA